MNLEEIFDQEYDNIAKLNLFPHISKELYDRDKQLLNSIVYDKIFTPLYNCDELSETYGGEDEDHPLIYTMKVRKSSICMSCDELKFLAEYLIEFAHTKFEPYAKAFIKANPNINDGITIDLRNLKFKNAKENLVYDIKLHIMDVQSAKLGLYTAARMCLRYLWCNAICRLEYNMSNDQVDKAFDEGAQIVEAEEMIDELESSVRDYYRSIKSNK